MISETDYSTMKKEVQVIIITLVRMKNAEYKMQNAECRMGFASLHYAHTDKNIIFLVSGALAE